MKDRPIALSLVLPLMLFGAAVFVASAPAQRGGFASRGAMGATGAMAARGGVAARGGGVRARPVRPRGTGRYVGGWGDAGLFYPDYDAGYDYGPVLETPPPQGVGFVPVPPALPEPPAKPAEAMVLERQGDQWVRIEPYGPPLGQAASPSNPAERASSATAAPARGQTAVTPPPAPLPPAVLVFRDGHQEQIGQYRIMGANIYINTDYWTSGAWTRTIPIADLDVPATLKLNQQRGANFRLPSSPNEVMIGG